jgi:hypothetical protein
VKAGVHVSTLEGHLAEVMFRNSMKCKHKNIHRGFYEALKEMYSVKGEPVVSYGTPLFHTWSSPNNVLQKSIINPIDSSADEGNCYNGIFPHQIMHTLGDASLTLVSVCMENLYALVKKTYKPLGLVTMMEYPFIIWYFREKKKPFNDRK